jgi:hypothetical protein
VVDSGLGEGDVVHAGADGEVVECVVAHLGQLDVDTLVFTVSVAADACFVILKCACDKF